MILKFYLKKTNKFKKRQMNRNVNQRDCLSDESGSRQFALLVYWKSGSQDGEKARLNSISIDGKVNIDSSIILQYNNIFGRLSIRCNHINTKNKGFLNRIDFK